MQTYRNYIDGKWVPSSSGKTFESLNPATENPIGLFQSGTKQDVDLAVQAAKKAYPAWSATPAPKRAAIILKAASLLRQSKQRLARTVATEMGKVLPEAAGDVQEAIDMAEYVAGEGRRLFGRTTPSELPDKLCMSIRTPLGIVGLITPWNFPIAIPSWKILPALLCGNTVVFKPASDTPLCAIEFVKILIEAGLPPGVLNLITGSGSEIGGAVVRHKDISAISFTGSKQTGEWIAKNAGLKKTGLELGGKNAVIVMDDADLDLAVDGIIWGAFGTTGQRCTATSRVIAHSKIRQKLERRLVSRAKSLRLGDPSKPTTDVGPLINKAAVHKVHSYTQAALDEGAKLLCGGSPKPPGFFYKPTIFTRVSPAMRIAKEEVFGPLLCILEAGNLGHAINLANSVEYGLSSAVYTKDISNAFKAIEKLEAGITYVNSSTIGAEVHLPFGGVKSTGGHKEAGWAAIDEFSDEKVVYIDYSGRLQKAQMD